MELPAFFLKGVGLKSRKVKRNGKSGENDRHERESRIAKDEHFGLVGAAILPVAIVFSELESNGCR